MTFSNDMVADGATLHGTRRPRVANPMTSEPILVLLVSDRGDVCVEVARYLEHSSRRDFKLDRASSSDTFEVLTQGGRDLWLIDAASDPSTVSRVRDARARGWDRPIVVLIDAHEPETEAAALAAGASDCLVRSEVTPALLSRVIRHLVDGWRHEKRAEARFRALIDDSPDHVLAERLLSTGTLASGVAHEINNPLASILGNVEHVMAELSTIADRARGTVDPPIAATDASALDELIEALADARTSAERVRVIVKDLRTFALTDEDEQGDIQPRAVLDAAINMAQNEIRHRAQLVRDYHDVPNIRANTARLGQVVLNLLLNAAQAIPEGNAAKNEIGVGLRRRGDHVLITVRDTGPGILPEHLGRIFDPFFTTKPVGVGTGLGLSICHSVVTSLGGEIRVESVVGGGTVFEVAFPAVIEEEPEIQQVSSTKQAVAVPRGRILFVDDDVMLGKAMLRALAKQHEIVVNSSAREALELLLGGESFDVVFCDLMMPDVTGMDFYAELAARLPNVAARVVFLTGGAFTLRAVEFLRTVPNARLDKPVNLPALRDLIAARMRSRD